VKDNGNKNLEDRRDAVDYLEAASSVFTTDRNTNGLPHRTNPIPFYQG